MEFCDNLTALRKARGLSQEQLGAEVGVSRQTVSKWELGSTTPELGKLTALSNYFGITMDELVGRPLPQQPVTGQTVMIHHADRCGWRYEYKSSRTLWGLPLVHVNICDHGLCRAKGIFAVGNVASGIVVLGTLSVGIISLGACSAGVFSLGALTLGLLFAVGGVSVGTVSVGGLALGVLSFGGCAVGVYAIGGLAQAAHVALGDVAKGTIAFGNHASGEITGPAGISSAAAMCSAILSRYPGTWDWLRRLLEWMLQYI